MSREEILKKLNEIFCEVFDDDGIVISEKTVPEDISSWDSLGQIHLIMACQKKFAVTFDFVEMGKMKTVSTIIDAISAKVK